MIRDLNKRQVIYGAFCCSVPADTKVGAVIANPNYSLETSAEGEYLGCPQCGAAGGEDEATFMAGFCIDCGYDGKPVQVRREAEPLMLRVQEVQQLEGSNGAFERAHHTGWVTYRAICAAVAE